MGRGPSKRERAERVLTEDENDRVLTILELSMRFAVESNMDVVEALDLARWIRGGEDAARRRRRLERVGGTVAMASVAKVLEGRLAPGLDPYELATLVLDELERNGCVLAEGAISEIRKTKLLEGRPTSE